MTSGDYAASGSVPTEIEADGNAHLKPEGLVDFEVASDLGRKVGSDVTSAILRTMAIGETPYQREVVAMAGSAAAVVLAGLAMRDGSVPDATDRDIIETLVEMVAEAATARAGREP